MSAAPRVGMVGAGQLARMTHQAAIDLDVRLEVLARDRCDPAVLAGAPHQIGRPEDLAALQALSQDATVITLDHELVPNEHLRALEEAGRCVRPSADAVAFAQDKLHARTVLHDRGYPVPDFAPISSRADLAAFAERHGLPVVLKARRGGYDGGGVRILQRLDDAPGDVGDGGWLVEELVPIAVELAVVTARRPAGSGVTYPVVETVQRDGICHELVMPARIEPALAAEAVALAVALTTDIDAVGIVAVELFVSTAGRLLVNELALRPHNSGHATIEASVTSQFHNHLRAVLDWPLGSTAMRAPAAATVNILASADAAPLTSRLPQALALPEARVHLYGKHPRPGRKVGHVTVLADRAEHALAVARPAAAILAGA